MKYRAKMAERWAAYNWCIDRFNTFYDDSGKRWETNEGWFRFRDEEDFLLFYLKWSHLVVETKLLQ